MDNYLNPTAFDRKVFRKELFPVSISATDTGKHDVKYVIDSIRRYNVLDAGFCYTCRCTNRATHWSFGYTDPVIHTSVKTLVHKLVARSRRKYGLYSTTPGAVPRKCSSCKCGLLGA